MIGRSIFRKTGGQKRKTDSEGSGRGSPKILRSTLESGEASRVHRYQITSIIKSSPESCSAFASTADGKRVLIKMMSAGQKRGIYEDLAQLSHKNLAKIRTPSITPHLIQLECFEQKNLKDRLQSEYGGVVLMEDTVRPWFAQLLDAVEFLHTNGIVHRDICCGKIYVQDENTVKLTGFGQATRYDGTPHCGTAGTVGYQAPEVILGREGYNPIPVDFYALGVVLHFLLTHTFPCGHDAESCLRLAGKIVMFDARKKLSEEVVELLRGLLSYVVADRWNSKRARNSDWMKDQVERGQTANQRRK
ncbi:hypothetical protein CAPTEDRAFT_198203 [Capitella teleta]|uniref:Protein kinase domain-containing protein n=1 Tax=Capitella teleta TaxID=283909 RepID=X1ZYD7_CAPTE|nr:hypothetical protein CAPTEDRAFT_198203 [Capitella teleta]|eukprot:ELU04740.1 hypothetical protein CAPTEDRAFT_198203 [Capitella teleta]